jgi:TRAP transporter 4TM/12TM fusion protein
MMAQEYSRSQQIWLVEKIALILAVAISLFHLYTGGFGLLSSLDQRGIHLLFMLILAFLSTGMQKGRLNWWDGVSIAFVIASSLYLLFTWRERSGAYIPTYADVIFGAMLIISVLEASRRHLGWALPITSMIFLAYALWGSELPGMLAHKQYSLRRLVSFLYTTTEGIYGLPIGISATFVILFILFGAFLNASGAGKLFIDVAFSLTGRARGGPAKAAVASSALMGSISGSPIANVVTTGTFTIPLMKKMGYPPYVAAAVEAVASTGGMIMPPVMGAVAFLIAEYLNISYLEVVKAALLPAILYYICVYFFIDFEACKRNLTGLSAEELPSFRGSVAKGWYALVPLVTLVVWIVIGWSPMRAAFWSIVVLVLIAGLMRLLGRSSLHARAIVDALKSGAENAVSVAVACACAGIILGVLGVTGLGVKLSQFILSLSGGSLFVGLLLTAITSLILGVGLPATAIYIMMAAINAPALIGMGASPIAAHLFLFYFGIISTITPPVALTAYAAAGLAEASPTKTGWKAFSFGILAYIMPFLFVYSSGFLMQGGLWVVTRTFLTAVIGVYFVGAAIQGYFRNHTITWLQRAIMGAGGFLWLDPHPLTDAAGAILTIIALVLYVRQGKGTLKKFLRTQKGHLKIF